MDDLRPIVLVIWGLMALAGLVLAGIAINLERRAFVAQGRGGAWLWLRLWTLPILALCALAVIVPARSIGGPEALAVFYGLLLTLAPLLYFTLHWLFGRLATPPLGRNESSRIALSGLLLIIVPALVAQLTQAPVHQLARLLRGVQLASAPLPYRVIEQRSFQMPGAGVIWYQHWQAPAGIVTARVERPLDNEYVRADGAGSTTMCRIGSDVHLFWPADLPLPPWRIEWRDAQGERYRSDLVTTPPATPQETFAVQWLADGVRLPVPVPRSLVSVNLGSEGSRENYGSIAPDFTEPGSEHCLTRDYHPSASGSAAPIRAISLRFWNRVTLESQFLRWRRSDESTP